MIRRKSQENSVFEAIEVEYLKLGIYVTDLDRPWLGTPFLLQGFLIDEEQQIVQLQQLCKIVYVDRRRSVGDNMPLSSVSARVVGHQSRHPGWRPTAPPASRPATVNFCPSFCPLHAASASEVPRQRCRERVHPPPAAVWKPNCFTRRRLSMTCIAH